MSAQKVFECDDLRKEILSYIPKRCKSCHYTMNKKIGIHNLQKLVIL